MFRAIALQPGFLARHGRKATMDALARITKSTRFVLDEEVPAFRLTGPDTPYHRHDPDLAAVLARHWPGVGPDEVAAFHRSEAWCDLCFEDGWSGLFIARALEARPLAQDLVLLHLDDHTDMMPTLLERRQDGVFDPATGHRFDPAEPEDWHGALASGAVGIGSFATALCQGARRVHVRHLNNVARSTHALYPLVRAIRRHALIPDLAFATIRKQPPSRGGGAGSYRGGPDPFRLLDDLPAGRVLVHIDLDYFINDFNGNPDQTSAVPDESLRRIAQGKLERFFAALARTGRPVERWIVATSPGFCAARHWSWLLVEIGRRIAGRSES